MTLRVYVNDFFSIFFIYICITFINLNNSYLFLPLLPDDPLNFFEDQPKRPTGNSVLKMFVDLFATRETAALFYTNDNKVLIDILVRQLSDLSAGDPVSETFCFLFRSINIMYLTKHVFFSSFLWLTSCVAHIWNCADTSCATPTTRNIPIGSPIWWRYSRGYSARRENAVCAIRNWCARLPMNSRRFSRRRGFRIGICSFFQIVLG